MVGETSVVTPERFTQGLTYADYLAQVNVNRDRFEQYYETAGEAVSQEDASFFQQAARQPGGPAKVLVLGEDWCPDVYRGMPLMARVAEASGMELRVFPRDANLDIMAEFLKDGEFLSIPTFVFYTAGHEYLGHWIERPEQANREMAENRAQVHQEMAGQEDAEVRRATRERNNARFPEWQRATVQELRALLSR